jgi:hypothetical protein
MSDVIDFRRYAQVSREIAADTRGAEQLLWSQLAQHWNAVANYRDGAATAFKFVRGRRVAFHASDQRMP